MSTYQNKVVISDPSPDRLDALVWALTEPMSRVGTTRPVESVMVRPKIASARKMPSA
jgi:phage terminase large subunit-like protein